VTLFNASKEFKDRWVGQGVSSSPICRYLKVVVFANGEKTR